MLIPVIVGIIIVLASGGNGEYTSTALAIDQDRGQLIRDAFGWMTFRKEGELMAESELEPLFVNPVIQKYVTSKFYRTFVIAFQQGVLPRMTLNQGDPCDPNYTLEYKDPFNNSVTWHYQKKFTFNAYDKRNEAGVHFCDYRQGLICKPTTKTCECPVDSAMQSIPSNGPVKRCLVQRDKVCTLIDIAHGNDPTHSALASNLHHLIFNLEKPLSCADGTQCRFKESNKNTPLCYDSNDGPWFPPPPFTDAYIYTVEKWDLEIGDQCAIGLYADPGSCKVKDSNDDLGPNPGFVCYNFGPPKSLSSVYPGTETRVGFCHFEYGVYGVTSQLLNSAYDFHPLVSAFVHPGTVPLRGRDLHNFYATYISKVSTLFDKTTEKHIEISAQGRRCSVEKTKLMEEAFRYFASLENDRLPGKDYVKEATEENLESMLQSLVDLKKLPTEKICKVYWDYERFSPSDPEPEKYPSLKCAPEDPPDSYGNDGRCQKFGIDTEPYGLKLLEFKEVTLAIIEEQNNEESNFRKDIFEENPEPPCLPFLAPLDPNQNGLQEPDTLPGGHCSIGFVCYQDYSDALGIYDTSCNLKLPSRLTQVMSCLDISKPTGKCENQQLDRMVQEALKTLDNYATAEKNQFCDYHLETILRGNDQKQINNLNRYLVLNSLQRGVLCNKNLKNLECTEKGVCSCINGNCREESAPTGMSLEELERKMMMPDDPAEENIESGGNAWLSQINVVTMIISALVVIL